MATATETTDLEQQVRTLQRRLEEAELRAVQAEKGLERKTIEMGIVKSAQAAGANPLAIDDLVDRALKSGQWMTNSRGQLMRVVEGVPEVDTDGNYLTPAAWLRSIKGEAGHLFADAQQQDTAADDGERNPWLKQYWNMSDQGRMYARDKEKAIRLAAAAGCKVGDTRPRDL